MSEAEGVKIISLWDYFGCDGVTLHSLQQLLVNETNCAASALKEYG